jgi:hypothetical protein
MNFKCFELVKTAILKTNLSLLQKQTSKEWIILVFSLSININFKCFELVKTARLKTNTQNKKSKDWIIMIHFQKVSNKARFEEPQRQQGKECLFAESSLNQTSYDYWNVYFFVRECCLN